MRHEGGLPAALQHPPTHLPTPPRPHPQIRRPNNYDITLALMLGPTDPNPAMEVSGAPSRASALSQSQSQRLRAALRCRPALPPCVAALRCCGDVPRHGGVGAGGTEPGGGGAQQGSEASPAAAPAVCCCSTGSAAAMLAPAAAAPGRRGAAQHQLVGEEGRHAAALRLASWRGARASSPAAWNTPLPRARLPPANLHMPSPLPRSAGTSMHAQCLQLSCNHPLSM